MTPAPIIKFTRSTSISALSDAIKNVTEAGCKTILLLTCIDNNYDEEQINRLLSASSLPICGGMFAQIIMGEETYCEGALVLGVMFDAEIANYSLLSTANHNLRDYIQKNSTNIADHKNFIVIADAFYSANENFTDQFYDYIGSGISAIGGGSGSLDFISRPSIYSNQGLMSDAIQIIALPCTINNAISHGWEILDGPYLVTASEGHYVHSLNYIATFDLYRDVIKKMTQQTLTEEAFFTIAKHFPLGIISIDGELLVRDPIKSDGCYLECVGNVPVNSMVYLLKGDPDSMICTTGKTAQTLAKSGAANTLLLFDCISRALFMGDKITDELKAIQSHFPDSCLVGAMSLGEIADTSNGAIRLLNKSTVIGSF